MSTLQIATPPVTPARHRWLMLVVVALAFALRVYRLDAQSLWYDEGFSAQVALGGFGDIFGYAGTDPHPPLYHALLWLWVWLAGGSEFALRFLSVGCGVVAIALMYRLGVVLGGSLLGLVAAILGVANPFLVYYSQEARMYGLFLALALFSTVCLARLSLPMLGAGGPAEVRGGRSPEQGRRSFGLGWALYSAATALLLLSHYFAVFVVLAHGVWVLMALGRPATFRWLKQIALAGLVTVPWVAYAAPILAGYQVQAVAPLDPVTAFRQVQVAFTTGVVPPEWPGGIATRLIPAAALGGLVVLAMQRRHVPALLMVLGFAAPLAGLYLLSLFRPTFNPRYVIVALPFLLLLAAALPAAFGRRFGIIAVALGLLLAVPFAPPLLRASTDPELARHDWRSLTTFVRERAGPDDVFMFNAWYAQYVFDYYVRSPQARIGVRSEQPLDADRAAALLNQAAERGRRIWLVLWQDEVTDPGGYLPATAEKYGRVIEQRWDGPMRVFAYEAPAGASAPFQPLAPALPASANLGGEIALEGYSVDRTEVAPGETLRVILYWRSLKQVTDDYRGFVHLLSKDLQVFGQLDKVTIGFYHPTSSWRPGELLRDEYVFQVAPETQPGEYLLEAGMYTHPDLLRRPVLGADGVSVSADSVVLPQRITVRAR